MRRHLGYGECRARRTERHHNIAGHESQTKGRTHVVAGARSENDARRSVTGYFGGTAYAGQLRHMSQCHRE